MNSCNFACANIKMCKLTCIPVGLITFSHDFNMSAERVVFLFFSWVHTCCHLFEVTLVWDFVEDFQIPLSQVAYTETGDRALFCFLTEQRFAGVCCFHMDSVRGRYRHPTFLKLMSRKEMYILILLTKPISALPVKQSPWTEHSLWPGTPPSLSPLSRAGEI